MILRAFSNAHTALKNRMEYLALVQGSNKSILEPIIAANFDDYIEQRFQLRQVFMTEERFARYREPSPPPPPPGSPPANGASPPPPPPLDGAHSPPPAPAARKPAKKPKAKLKGTKSEPEDISSDEAPGPDAKSAEAKSAKARKGETRRQLCQERAARLKRLRPDLKKLPNTLSLRQARRHAGYETDEQMNADLDSREQKLLASA